MQEVYLKNYWLLNLEFIETFASLTYRDIPLPLLSNFYQYLDNSLKQEMMREDFNNHLIIKTLDESQIQPQFEKWLTPIQKPMQKKPIQGKTLLNFDYLRFSVSNYSQFDPNDTLILARWRKQQAYNIPVICMADYTRQSPDIADSFIQQAHTIFASHENHPAFNNSYFKEKFLANIPLMIEKIDMVNLIFEKNLISSVVVGTTEEITSRILTLVASSKGIPSFCLQHGVIMGEEAFFPVFATKQVVHGFYEKDLYLQKGVEENRISVVGHPRFDDIFTINHMSKSSLLLKMGLNAQKKIVFIATQPFNTSFYVELTKLLIKDPEIAVIIKPHPWEKSRNLVSEYVNLSKVYSSVKYVTNEVNIYDIIANSDIVVVANSTVGLEAMLLNKPVVIYKSQSLDRNYPYYDTLDGLVSHDAETASMIIHNILYHPPTLQMGKQVRDQFLNHNYPQKTAVPKLHKLIKEMTGKSNDLSSKLSNEGTETP
ncbi:CDP-glycerol glycerophosphotransferase family protein [Bacillus bingmayongensis]|uniref:capsular polysaccharide export protein, LipB/KpsS family n=1 Tax=Bacillus bingmayongensis TaxID=1150157 RepID=UPI0002F5E11B|nr:CDP-glycerol glycerophosphotransferase family protein [Bacillus bingmayongensis]